MTEKNEKVDQKLWDPRRSDKSPPSKTGPLLTFHFQTYITLTKIMNHLPMTQPHTLISLQLCMWGCVRGCVSVSDRLISTMIESSEAKELNLVNSYR